MLGATLVVLLVIAALAIVVASGGAQHPKLAPFAEPSLLAAAYAAAACGLALLILRVRAAGNSTRVRLAVMALAGFMVIMFTGFGFDVRLRKSENAAESVRQLKEQLPPGQHLVSLGGHTAELFAYLYGEPIITPRPWPEDGNDQDLSYFCFMCPGNRMPQLPFAWKLIGIVSMDRNRRPVPETIVVVGFRLPVPAPGVAFRDP